MNSSDKKLSSKDRYFCKCLVFNPLISIDDILDSAKSLACLEKEILKLDALSFSLKFIAPKISRSLL